MGEDRWEGKRKVEVVVVLDGAVVLVVEETVDKRRWGSGQRITGQEWGLPTLRLLFSQSRTRTGRDWRKSNAVFVTFVTSEILNFYGWRL